VDALASGGVGGGSGGSGDPDASDIGETQSDDIPIDGSVSSEAQGEIAALEAALSAEEMVTDPS
jgi:hypothetical protein